MSFFIVCMLTFMVTLSLWLFSNVVANCMIYIEMTQRASGWRKLDWIMFTIAVLVAALVIPYNFEVAIPHSPFCPAAQVMAAIQMIQIAWGYMLLLYTKREIARHPLRYAPSRRALIFPNMELSN